MGHADEAVNLLGREQPHGRLESLLDLLDRIIHRLRGALREDAIVAAEGIGVLDDFAGPFLPGDEARAAVRLSASVHCGQSPD